MSLQADIIKQIQECNDVVYRVIPVPEWGLSITIRSMMGGERDAFEQQIHKDKNDKREDVRAKFVVACACVSDSDPTLLFSQEDVSWLTKKNAQVLDRLFDVCRELSGYAEEKKS